MRSALAIAALVASCAAHAQPPSQATLNWCRAVAKVHASDIGQGRAVRVYNSRFPSWEQAVIDYMLQAKDRARYLTRDELAAAGYAYCVERRPTGM